jgi:putative transposase
VGNRAELIEPCYPGLSVRQQCVLLDVNRSSLYYSAAEVDQETLNLLRLIDEIYTKYPFFGTRKMVSYLERHHACSVGRSRVRRLYQTLGIEAVCPGPNTSKPHPENKIYPYLLRGVSIMRPNQVWSTDITYLRLTKGFAYLVAIIDWYSRYVLDWEISINLEASFCVDTLQRVVAKGKCDIFNTDQGSQFTSHAFINVLKEHEIAISMDGKGRALDNIFVERLWRSVKYECVYLHEWNSVKQIRQGINGYFDFYNHDRPHQSLDGRTPHEVYFS